MPVRDPQNEFPGIPWIGLSLGISILLIGNPEFPGIFRHFPGEGCWGPRIAVSGEDEVDMLGSGELRLAFPPNGAMPPPLGTWFHTGTSVRYPSLQP